MLEMEQFNLSHKTMDLTEHMPVLREERKLPKSRLVLTEFMEEKTEINPSKKERSGWRMVRRCSEYEDLSVDVSTGKITFPSYGSTTSGLQRVISSYDIGQKPYPQISDEEQWNPSKINPKDNSDDDIEMLDMNSEPQPSTSENADLEEFYTTRKLNAGYVTNSMDTNSDEMYVNEDYNISPKNRVSLICKKAFKSKLCKAISIDTPFPNNGNPSRRHNLHLQTQSFDLEEGDY